MNLPEFLKQTQCCIHIRHDIITPPGGEQGRHCARIRVHFKSSPVVILAVLPWGFDYGAFLWELSLQWRAANGIDLETLPAGSKAVN